MVGKIVTLPATWSITKERTNVKVIEVNYNDWTCKVEYPNGYTETMPISSLEGY